MEALQELLLILPRNTEQQQQCAASVSSAIATMITGLQNIENEAMAQNENLDSQIKKGQKYLSQLLRNCEQKEKETEDLSRSLFEAWHQYELAQSEQLQQTRKYKAETRLSKMQLGQYQQQRDIINRQLADRKKSFEEENQNLDSDITELQTKIDQNQNNYKNEIQTLAKQRSADQLNRQTQIQDKITQTKLSRLQHNETAFKNTQLPLQVRRALDDLELEKKILKRDEEEAKRAENCVVVWENGFRKIYSSMAEYQQSLVKEMKSRYSETYQAMGQVQQTLINNSIQSQKRKIQVCFYRRLLKIYVQKIEDLVKEREHTDLQIGELDQQLQKLLYQPALAQLQQLQSMTLQLQIKAQSHQQLVNEHNQEWLLHVNQNNQNQKQLQQQQQNRRSSLGLSNPVQESASDNEPEQLSRSAVQQKELEDERLQLQKEIEKKTFKVRQLKFRLSQRGSQ